MSVTRFMRYAIWSAGEAQAERGRLDRRAPGVELGGVVPEDRHVADVAPGGEALGDDRGATDRRRGAASAGSTGM
jgi:hypothetical protein